MNFRLFFPGVRDGLMIFVDVYRVFLILMIFLQKKHGDFHKQPWDDLSKSLGIRIE
jgi:hypothetical protein